MNEWNFRNFFIKEDTLPSNEQNNGLSNRVRNAFNKSIRTISNILAPLIVLAIAKDFQDIIKFVTENLIIHDFR